MKKLLIAIFGEENAEKPANKAIEYAVIGTAAALVLTVLILIISSIALSLGNKGEAEAPAGDGEGSGSGNGTTQTTTIEYDTATVNDLNAKLGEAVGVQSSRSSIDGGIYYAAHGQDKLIKNAQTALDKMLVDFYNNNKSKLVIDTAKADCNVPFAHGSDGKYTIKIDDYKENSTFNVDLYSWIYNNAYKYGYVYDGNTFTYVGVAAATYMKNNSNMTYTAFLSKIKSSTNNLTVKGYEMYYLAADAAELKVPKSLSYTVIAVGSDGYIITVTTSKTNG
ncbi:MAG: D-alanyl-D-alanine carboxypeptidase family protein [Ruminococcaceae bacterium]|nr:D-alanyl-D-alanine carboxypeptidase family protein [Oscillospiraceae bacterium]